MSFLKKEDAGNAKFVSKGDVISLMVLTVLIIGGYFGYGHLKEESFRRVTEAEAVFATKDYVKSYAAFESLDDLVWKSDSLDSIIYDRMSFLADRKENQRFLLDEMKERHGKKDTNGVLESLKKWDGVEFLEETQKVELEELKSLYAALLDTAVADSTEKDSTSTK